jgi:hypothetical protein
MVHFSWEQMFIILVWTVCDTWHTNTNIHPVAMNSLWHMMLEYKCWEYWYEQSVIHDAQTQMFKILLWTVNGTWCLSTIVTLLPTVYGAFFMRTNVHKNDMNSLWYMMHKHKYSSCCSEQSMAYDVSVHKFRILLWSVCGSWCTNKNIHPVAMNSLWHMMLEYRCSEYCY